MQKQHGQKGQPTDGTLLKGQSAKARRFLRDRRGVTTTQYTLLLAGLVVFALLGGSQIGGGVSSSLDNTADQATVSETGGGIDPDENSDTMPDALSITPLSDQPLATRVTSESVSPIGFDGPQIISVTGDGTPRVSVNGGAYRTSLNISPGDSFTVQVTTSAMFQVDTVATVTIGSYSTDFVATTVSGPDLTPDPFPIPAVTDALLSSEVTSDAVSVADFEGPIQMSVAGLGSPELSVNGGSWSTTPDINPGDSFRVRMTSAATRNVQQIATVTIGTVSETFSVTTNNCPSDIETFTHTGADQSFMIPAGCTRVAVAIWGAGGGGGGCTQGSTHSTFSGGAGGYTTGELVVTPGETLNMVVGGGGASGDGSGNDGGYGGGGNGVEFAGGGGGYSGLFRGTVGSQVNALLVAGGGGGGGAVTPVGAGSSHNGGPGGGGAGYDDGASLSNGLGGTASTGGAGGQDLNGSAQSGSNGSVFAGGDATLGAGQGAGGGGAGYYGGGGGGAMSAGPYAFGSSAGGGGSGYVETGSVTQSQMLAGNGSSAPFTSHTAYGGGAATGGAGGDSCADGGHGRVILDFQGVVQTQDTNLAPVWLTQSGTILTTLTGVDASVKVQANDPEGSTVTYSVSSGTIPLGLSLNGSTGEISGTVTGTGSGTFTLSASDGADSSTRSFTIATRSAASCLDYARVIEQSTGSLSAADDGVYNIDPDGDGGPILPYDVHCDMGVDGGGWTAATMLADGTTGNLFQTGNTDKITSVSTSIATRGQVGDIWTDSTNRDILLRCWSDDATVQAGYNDGFVIYDFDKSDIGNLTRASKANSTLSSTPLAARSFGNGLTVDMTLSCNWRGSGNTSSHYIAAIRPESATQCADEVEFLRAWMSFGASQINISAPYNNTMPQTAASLYGSPTHCMPAAEAANLCSGTTNIHFDTIDGTGAWCVSYLRESQGVGSQDFPPIWQTDNSTTTELAAEYAIETITYSASDAEMGILTYAVASGSSLPPGLVLATNGELTGIPTTPGAYDTVIEVSDGSNTVPRTFSYNVEYAVNCSRHRDELIRVNGSVSSADNGPRLTDVDGHAGAVVAYSVYCDMGTDGGGWEAATLLADPLTDNHFNIDTARIPDITDSSSSKGDLEVVWAATDTVNKDLLLKCVSSDTEVNSQYNPGLIIYDIARADVGHLTKQSKQRTDSGIGGLTSYNLNNDHSFYMLGCYGPSGDAASTYFVSHDPVANSTSNCASDSFDGSHPNWMSFKADRLLLRAACELGAPCYAPGSDKDQLLDSSNYCVSYVRDAGTVAVPPAWKTPLGYAITDQTFRVGVAITPIDIDADGTGSISYSVSSGALPDGLSISSAQITGTPITPGANTFTLRATDGTTGRHGDRTFAITVEDAIGIAGAGTTGDPREWADATQATSCDEYRNPVTPGYAYQGDTGSGIYLIDPDGAGGSAAFQAECEMSFDGGGWTKINHGTDTVLGDLTKFPTSLNNISSFTVSGSYGVSWGGFVTSSQWSQIDTQAIVFDVSYDELYTQVTGFYDVPSGGLGNLEMRNQSSTMLLLRDSHTDAPQGQSYAIRNLTIFSGQTTNVVDDIRQPLDAGSTELRVRMHAFTSSFAYTRRYIRELWYR
ncbi:MAG: hypothetical protein Alpg2KO_26120 [Alphaproteobacteria bacterium]